MRMQNSQTKWVYRESNPGGERTPSSTHHYSRHFPSHQGINPYDLTVFSDGEVKKVNIFNYVE